MKKELIRIGLFFIVILTLVSLLSYSPTDPSIHHAKSTGQIHNVFGFIGAHLAGLLVGLFGIGSFWIPVLFLVSTIKMFGVSVRQKPVSIVFGSMLLIITTGALLAFQKHHILLFGESFHSGGGIGFAVKDFLKAYANPTGGTIILIVLFIIGLILAIGFSPTRFVNSLWSTGKALMEKGKALYLFWKARKEKKKKSPLAKKQAAAPLSPDRKAAPEIQIKTQPPPPPKPPKPKQGEFDFMRSDGEYSLPPISFLDPPAPRPDTVDDENLRMQSMLLEKKLNDFGVEGKVEAVSPGPVITTFEYKPAPGVKINKIVNLTDDLALALRAMSIRIVAPIPGKAVIGIEIPNETREAVSFREIIASDVFEESKSKLTICLGKDIVGNPVVAQLDKMPHLLIAGATGAGKSVGLNAMISSLLYKATPHDVKFIMVDPKRIELSMYNGIPHLITPVVTDMKKATNALFWAVREMERRYELLSEHKCRNISQYNKKVGKDKKDGKDDAGEELPYIVIIIDELADLMMVASRDVEVALTRLAQMARASGLHIILATQRPSVDVLTGIIKANFPTRISFQVSSKIDSRTIIDSNGAENLLGAGDMLYLPPGTGKLQRIHGAFISEEELTKVIDFLKQQKPPEYDENITEAPVQDGSPEDNGEHDEHYDAAVALVTKTRKASISMIQRHLRIGYNRAARIIEMMEMEGLIGPADGAKPREVLAGNYEEIP
ncbi:MAG: DNA translocase FtsK [Desulfobacteraceae bacterium]|nr:MAG: DNA translocase FtsK [Desulfobacteraceae bacterium]